MKNLFHRILCEGSKFARENRLLRGVIYRPLRGVLRKRFATFSYALSIPNPNSSVTPDEWHPPIPSRYTFGILRDSFFSHVPYCAACQELGIAYKVIDWMAVDWVDRIKKSGCDAFLAWPGECIEQWKRMYDDRLRFMVEDMGRIVYPSLKALWLYGSKERQQGWLEIHGFPHPDTWVFYNQNEALDFVEKFDGLNVKPGKGGVGCLVAKVDIGSSALGVRILHTKAEAKAYVAKAFSIGVPNGAYCDVAARQWRHVFFQRHIGEAREWRMIRLGDSYFGYEKVKRGEFHSGTGLGEWNTPSNELLQLIHSVAEECGSSCMSMDVFQVPEGKLYINEMQCMFGAYDTAQMYVNGTPGRFVRNQDGVFAFEKGHFCVNHCCNLRVEDLISILDAQNR